MTESLIVHSCVGLPLWSALSAVQAVLRGDHGNTVFATLQSPGACHVVRVDYRDGAASMMVVDASGQTLAERALQPEALAAVFDARVFSLSGELRWVNDATGRSQHLSAILTETDRPLPGEWETRRIRIDTTLEHRYLLLGQAKTSSSDVPDTPAPPNGWTRIRPQRSPSRYVPATGTAHGRCAWLVTREYCAKDTDLLDASVPGFGNVVAFEERGLEIVLG